MGLSVFVASLLASETSAPAPERIPAALTAEVDPEFDVDSELAPTFSASHAAGKEWTQAELLERAKTLATLATKIRVDVFRVYENRSNDGELLERRAVFPEIQFYSPRRESHSQVTDPTPVEFMAVWVDDSLEFVFAVSSATYRKRFVPARNQWEHPRTPRGSFSPIYLNPLHHSKTYKAEGTDIGPEMPFSVFIDLIDKELLTSSSGYAFHGTTLSHYEALGTPDSGGCIRMSREDAEVFYALLNPALTPINRFGKWYGERDRRNLASDALLALRDRMTINIIDPQALEQDAALAADITTRYAALVSYLYVEVNGDIERTKETLRRGHHRTLSETIKSKN